MKNYYCTLLSVLLLGCNVNDHSSLDLKEENHDRYFSQGVSLIGPFLTIDGAAQVPVTGTGRDRLMEGLRYLDAVAQIAPRNYAAFWMMGKAYQSLSDREHAYIQFKRSFSLNKDNPDVARELMIACVELGKGQEAVDVALHALALDSFNTGLMGNLALACLINGETARADRTIKTALAADPSDQVNQTLSGIIREVIEGKRPAPKNYDDIQQ